MTVVFFTILPENGFFSYKSPENPQNQSHQNRTQGPKEGKADRIAKGCIGGKENDGIDNRSGCQEGNGRVCRDLLFQKSVDNRNNPTFTWGKNKADKGSKQNSNNLVLRKKGMDPVRSDIDIDKARYNRPNEDKGQGFNHDRQKDGSHLQDRSR